MYLSQYLLAFRMTSVLDMNYPTFNSSKALRSCFEAPLTGHSQRKNTALEDMINTTGLHFKEVLNQYKFPLNLCKSVYFHLHYFSSC